MVRTSRQKITIIRTSKPIGEKDINKEILWFCRSFGFIGLRDKDKSKYRIFIALLQSAKKGRMLSSDQLAYKLNLSRGTVIHHINQLIEAGVVVVEKNKYVLRVSNLEVLVEEIRKDLERTCNDMKDVAKLIDEFMGL